MLLRRKPGIAATCATCIRRRARSRSHRKPTPHGGLPGATSQPPAGPSVGQRCGQPSQPSPPPWPHVFVFLPPERPTIMARAASLYAGGWGLSLSSGVRDVPDPLRRPCLEEAGVHSVSVPTSSPHEGGVSALPSGARPAGASPAGDMAGAGGDRAGGGGNMAGGKGAAPAAAGTVAAAGGRGGNDRSTRSRNSSCAAAAAPRAAPTAAAATPWDSPALKGASAQSSEISAQGIARVSRVSRVWQLRHCWRRPGMDRQGTPSG